MKPFLQILGLIITLCTAWAPMDLRAQTSPSTPLSKAVGNLRASNDEWKRELAAFREARAKGTISKSEVNDYAAFVAGLRSTVLVQCETVRRLGGEDMLKNFDCLAPPPSRLAGVIVVPGSAARTEEEKISALQARLNAIEGDIDADLLKRQQEIRSSAVSGGSSGGGGGTAAGGGTAGGTASTGTMSSSAAPSSEGGTMWSDPRARGSTATAPNMPQTDSPKRKSPSDLGSDDDVVARQLREAAEKETDPVLKEKLWEEYKKYKEAKR